MNIQLKKYELSDAEELVQKANNPNIARFLTDGFPSPYTLEDAHKFIQKFGEQEPTQVFLIMVDDAIAGGIGLHLQSDIMRLNAELGYWVAEELWGKGIASHAIDMIVNYGFDRFEITRIYARPFGSNIASQRVLEKCGFKLEASIAKNIIKNGIVEDELIYAIRKDKNQK